MASNIYPQGNNIDYNFMWRVSQGLVPGWDFIRKFGSGVVGTSLTSIWSGAAEQPGLYVYPDDSGSTAMQIYSTSSEDGPLGLGARVVQVLGIGPDLEDFQSEFVELNGTTPVPLTKQYSRTFRMSVVDTGDPLSNTANIGDIHLTDLSDSVMYAHIKDNNRSFGQTAMAIFTLPTKYKGYFTSASFSSNNNKVSSVYVYGRNPSAALDYPPEYNVPFRMAFERKLNSTASVIDLPVPEVIYGGQDVEVRGDTADQAGTDNIAAQFYIIYNKVRP